MDASIYYCLSSSLIVIICLVVHLKRKRFECPKCKTKSVRYVGTIKASPNIDIRKSMHSGMIHHCTNCNAWYARQKTKNGSAEEWVEYTGESLDLVVKGFKKL